MFQRLRKIIKLSKKDPDEVERLLDSQVDGLPDEDTKAVFLGQGTEDEYKEQEKQDKGLKGIFGL